MHGHDAQERAVAKVNQGTDRRARLPPKKPSVHSKASKQHQPRAEDSSGRGAEVAVPTRDNKEATDEDEPERKDKPRAEPEPDQDSALETARLLKMQMKMRKQEHDFIRKSLHPRRHRQTSWQCGSRLALCARRRPHCHQALSSRWPASDGQSPGRHWQ